MTESAERKTTASPFSTASPFNIGDTEVHVEGTGPDTVIMVHGFPDTHRLWDGTVAALKDRYQCARFTLPGFVGPVRREGYPLEEIIGIIQAIADQLSPDRKVILLCHDWGCMFTYQYYARYPDRVAKVIGVDIGDPRTLRREIDTKGLVMILSYQWFLAAAWRIGGTVGNRMTFWMRARMRCPSDPAPVSWQMAWPYYMTWFGGYRGKVKAFRPTCPMLFIYAKKKPFMFHAQSWIDELKSKPGNEVHGFDCGHWVMLQQPEQFNGLVRRWLTSG
jgi:cis-3-alkyl-4-acyloxetan-2-one decarboxylase